HCPARIEIAAGIERLAERLLGRDVGDGSADLRGRRIPRSPVPGETEVPELRGTRRREPDVGGRDVAMDDAAAVEVLESACNLPGDLHRSPDGKATIGRSLECRMKVTAREVFAHDERPPVVFAGIEDGHDVRMLGEL